MPEIEPVVLPSFTPTSQRAPAASPFQFFLTGAENLRITTFNSKAGVVVRVLVRFLGDNNTVQWQQFDQTPNTNATKRVTDFALGRGYILNVIAFAIAGTPRIGETFVQVKIIGGLSGATIVLGTLLQGYVTESQDIAWPGSPIQSSTDGGGVVKLVVLPDPTLGTSLNYDVPAGVQQEILSVRCLYTADATVITRAPRLQLRTGTTTWYTTVEAGNITASMTVGMSFAQGTPQSVVGTGLFLAASIGAGIVVLATSRVSVIPTNQQAGDRIFQASITVREWLDAQ